MNPKFPIYIVSKGRAESRLTVKSMIRMNLDFKIVIEEHDLESYEKVIDINRILVLPKKYLDEYDTCDNRKGISKGPGAARNFCWQDSIDKGFTHHWVLDDNLDDFHRLNKNMKIPVRSGATFKAAEDFVNRYDNVAISGFNYYSFCKSTDKVPPYVLNTRIYSCLLIKNSINYRWRGRYNEDTDLSLRVLKDGLCTIQFNAFLCGKVTTQRMKGGNSEEFYNKEGTHNKSKMIADLHPDVARVKWLFNRWHHKVNYNKFKENKLILKKGVNFKKIINNYGMKLIETDGKIK